MNLGVGFVGSPEPYYIAVLGYRVPRLFYYGVCNIERRARTGDVYAWPYVDSIGVVFYWKLAHSIVLVMKVGWVLVVQELWSTEVRGWSSPYYTASERQL